MIIERCSISNRDGAEIERDTAVSDVRESVRGQVMWPLLRHDDEVRMRDPVAMYEIADALRGEDRSHSAADTLGDGHDVLREKVWHIREVVDVLLGNDEALARCRRLQRHEGGDQVIVVDEACRRSTSDDVTEDAGHVARSVVVTSATSLPAA